MDAAKSDATESHGSSPSKTMKQPRSSGQATAVGTYFRMRTETPTEPHATDRAFLQMATTDTAVGNPHFTAELIDEGHLGYFLPRDKTNRVPTTITMDVDNYHAGIRKTLTYVLKRLLRKSSELGNEDIQLRTEEVANVLADGCCIITYMKLRALLYIHHPDYYTSTSLRRPKVHPNLAIPTGYAFAIQQLGIVNVSDLDHEKKYVPVFPSTGHRHGVPENRSWNPNLYAEYVEYARKLGMQFNIVDLTKKRGTAWWLLKQHYDEEIFELKCSLPETNFTDSMALTATLFLDGYEPDPSNAIFDLTPLGDESYGYILRDPHSGINVSTFEAIESKSNELVAMV